MLNHKKGLLLTEIAKICKGELLGNIENSSIIIDLLTDSRNITSTNNCLFFALVSKRNDGHKYISELYQKGMRSFVISKKIDDISII